MSFSVGETSISLEDILQRTNEVNILNYYLGIKNIPCLISSPLRDDKNPSFGLYSPKGTRIYYRDFSTGDRGGLFDLLCRLWNLKYTEVLVKIGKDLDKIPNIASNINSPSPYSNRSIKIHSTTDLQVKVRDWKSYDLEYWESYGITKQWLEYADVYPISRIFITKENSVRQYPADKYAYAYIEYKEGKVTLKVYQPFNKFGYKWTNKHDKSVVSLWTKVPNYGERICICSSVKDALCLWSNTGIPSLAVQGEGYNMSKTAVNELKGRFKKIYVLFDNDTVGIQDGQKFSSATGFINVVLPYFKEGKDISDLFLHLKDKDLFKEKILKLFN